VSGEARNSLVASDRSTATWVTITGGSQLNHQYPSAYLGAHQPVRRRDGCVEQRIADPYVIDVMQSKPRVLEQVRDLRLNLKRILIQEVQVEALIHC
jgi:hypothetical protein